MLLFVIPLKSAKISKNWLQRSRIFERCLKAACNQTSDQFRVIVVCNEKPEIQFSHPAVEFLQVDFLPPEKEKHPIAKGLTDKGRRVLRGLIHARDSDIHYSHAMLVDADDCVSNRLAEFIERHRDCHGWYLSSGYKYREGESSIYIKRMAFYRMSGTANILRFDLLDLPELPEYNRGYGYYKFYLNHQKVKSIMAERGTALKSLPFPGAAYILSTGDNMSGNDDHLSFNWFNRKKLTPAIVAEFGLYSIDLSMP